MRGASHATCAWSMPRLWDVEPTANSGMIADTASTSTTMAMRTSSSENPDEDRVPGPGGPPWSPRGDEEGAPVTPRGDRGEPSLVQVLVPGPVLTAPAPPGRPRA